MTADSKRRWFRYSLRTLFVVVTVAGLGSWIGNQLNWIRQRHEFLTTGMKQSLTAIDENRFLIDLNRLPGDGGFRLAPGVLWLFGERGIKNLNLGVPKKRFVQPRPNPASYYLPESDSYLQRARELFPESALFFFPYAERD